MQPFLSIFLAICCGQASADVPGQGFDDKNVVWNVPRADNDWGSPPEPLTLAHDTLAFAVQVYNILGRDSGNMVFSPYDIARMMGLLHSGARGATLSEIRKALQWHLSDDDLEAAFHDSERDLMGNDEVHLRLGVYGLARVVAPEAFHVQNLGRGPSAFTWAKSASAQRLEMNDFLRRAGLAFMSSLVLSSMESESAVKTAPNKKSSTRHDFDLRAMKDQNTILWADSSDYKMVEIAYKNKHFSLVIVLPKGSGNSVRSSPTAGQWGDMLNSLEVEEAQISLPAFSIASQFKLRRPLNELGMAVALSDNADFGAWGAGTRGLSVRDVLHKATIEVNESVVAASAITGVKLQGAEAKIHVTRPGKPLSNPFIFMVRDTVWGIPLILGRVEVGMQ